MGLALGQLEGDGAALGIDQRMDPGGRSTVRTTHATGSVVFFGHGSMLAHPHTGSANHLNVAVVSL